MQQHIGYELAVTALTRVEQLYPKVEQFLTRQGFAAGAHLLQHQAREVIGGFRAMQLHTCRIAWRRASSMLNVVTMLAPISTSRVRQRADDSAPVPLGELLRDVSASLCARLHREISQQRADVGREFRRRRVTARWVAVERLRDDCIEVTPRTAPLRGVGDAPGRGRWLVGQRRCVCVASLEPYGCCPVIRTCSSTPSAYTLLAAETGSPRNCSGAA